jgi:hypothetical protein
VAVCVAVLLSVGDRDWDAVGVREAVCVALCVAVSLAVSEGVGERDTGVAVTVGVVERAPVDDEDRETVRDAVWLAVSEGVGERDTGVAVTVGAVATLETSRTRELNCEVNTHAIAALLFDTQRAHIWKPVLRANRMCVKARSPQSLTQSPMYTLPTLSTATPKG